MADVIYALSDPSGETRYIGSTNNLKRRIYEHSKDTDKGSHLSRWICTLYARGLTFSYRVLAITSPRDWENDERYFIKFFKEEVGAPLVNKHPGGNGCPVGLGRPGHKWSQESRRKVSVSLKQHPDKKELSERRACSIRGVPLPSDRRAKISRKLMGYAVSVDTARRVAIGNEIYQLNLRRAQQGKLPVS